MSSGGGFQVLIPARYQAHRLPGKLLLEIEGKTILQRTWERACRSTAEQVRIVTDDPRIYTAATGFGAQVLQSVQAHASGTERLSEAVQLLELPANALVVNVQGDEPLIPPAVIDQAAACLEASPEAEIATAWTPIATVEELLSPDVVKLMADARECAAYFSRAPIPWAREAFADGMPRTLPPQFSWRRHLGIYAYRVRVLQGWRQMPPSPWEQAERLEQLRALWHGMTVQLFEVCEPAPPGVDTEEDLEALRAQVRIADAGG